MSAKAQNSVLIKEPMSVIEVPDKKIIPVDSEDESKKRSENIHEDSSAIKEDHKKPLETDMDVTMSEEIPPNNET